jgi:uncharacterized Zn finger protein
MDNCPKCEEGDLEVSYIDVTGEWAQIVVECDNCGTFFQGDLQISDFVEVEGMLE